MTQMSLSDVRKRGGRTDSLPYPGQGTSMGILQRHSSIHSHIPSSSRCLEPSGSLRSKGSCLVWCCCGQSGWCRFGPFHELRGVVLVVDVVVVVAADDVVAPVVTSAVVVEGVIAEVRSVVADADDAGQHVEGEECRMPYIFGEREREDNIEKRAPGEKGREEKDRERTNKEIAFFVFLLLLPLLLFGPFIN